MTVEQAGGCNHPPDPAFANDPPRPLQPTGPPELHTLRPTVVYYPGRPDFQPGIVEWPSWSRHSMEETLRATVIALVLVNIVLAALPRPTEARSPARWGVCCQGEGPEAYCCDGCCWFGRDCVSDAECRDR